MATDDDSATDYQAPSADELERAWLEAALARAAGRLRPTLRVCTLALPGGLVLAYVGLDAVAVGADRAGALRTLAANLGARLASQATHDQALLAALEEALR